MRSFRWVTFCLGTAGLTACGDAPLSPSEFAALARAEQRWRALGAATYRVESRRLCFCPREVTEWATIEVTDGVVTAVTLLDGTPLSADLWGAHPPVAERFDLVRGTPDYVSDVVLAFDLWSGILTRIEFRPDRTVADGA